MHGSTVLIDIFGTTISKMSIRTIAGLRHINETEILRCNVVFFSMLGLSQFPAQLALWIFLKKLLPGSKSESRPIRPEHSGDHHDISRSLSSFHPPFLKDIHKKVNSKVCDCNINAILLYRA